MFVVAGLILFCVVIDLMFKHYAYKKKIYEVRCQMQQAGLIPNSVNLKMLFYTSLYFWFFPMCRFKSLSNEEHNNLLKKCNRLNYVMIGLFFAIPISMSLLSGI